jgi:integrase
VLQDEDILEHLRLEDLIGILLGKEGMRKLRLRKKSNPELFRLWRDDLKLRYRSERALKEAHRVMGNYEAFLDGRPPDAELAKSYLSQFTDRATNTLARYAVLVGQFMTFYGDPLDLKIRTPQTLPPNVNPEDIAKIEEAIRRRKTHKGLIERDLLIVHTLRLTGIRRSELAHLKVEHLDFQTRFLTIRKGKGEKDRIVPLADSLRVELERFCRGKSPEESVFGLKDISISGFISVWAQKAGVPWIHVHSFRHLFATEIAEIMKDPTVVKELLGHGDLNVSQRYINVRAERLRSAIDQLDGRGPRLVETKTTGEAEDKPSERGGKTEAPPGMLEQRVSLDETAQMTLMRRKNPAQSVITIMPAPDGRLIERVERVLPDSENG